MDPSLPEADWSIRMGTKLDSRKVRDIRMDPRVTPYDASSSPDGDVVDRDCPPGR